MSTRYQIATKAKIKPRIYRFSKTNSMKAIYGYMERCIADKMFFDARNMQVPLLEEALIKLHKDSSHPIIVKNERFAKILSITHGVTVYSPDNMPNAEYVIFYWDMKVDTIPIHQNMYPLLVVMRTQI